MYASIDVPMSALYGRLAIRRESAFPLLSPCHDWRQAHAPEISHRMRRSARRHALRAVRHLGTGRRGHRAVRVTERQRQRARTTLSAYPGESPVLNFSGQSESSSNRGIQLNADYWHLYGLTVEHAADNGIYVAGSNNVIERVVTAYNRDTGLQLGRISSGAPSSQWPSNNLVVSSESHDTKDSTGENADGFASKLTTGTGNVFRYDVSHNNIDDGWDLYTKTDTGAIGPVAIEYALSYGNGTLSDGTQNKNGDRNGYKLGGDDIAVNHLVRHDIAYRNGHHGFTYNSNPGTMAVSHNVSVDNTDRDFAFDKGTSVFRHLDRHQRLPLLRVLRGPRLVLRLGRSSRGDLRRQGRDAVRAAWPAHDTLRAGHHARWRPARSRFRTVSGGRGHPVTTAIRRRGR
ncbi:hypothetical protein GCM10010339_45870 [Streptomyces alanosinicus]|uniref:Pectate disaccharide-lyase n=1 Tax=Streptomyces alanosinicus TaxID=68171 RepID=A0A919D3U3_9ACTN|nr:hypothetical protein GCM10010339_45870 [Streptomyces alanosinicus]